ncbi:MAG: NYN domain-containing protein, partial [Demequinaceae bacterium]|nr:NYN domain-containing protein [Demequinaceae bacterium]
LVIAVAPEWAFTVKALAPFARLMVREGRHGADLELCNALEDTDFIASRYSEVVIASGDHIFCASVRALADAGVPTTVACLPQQTSSELTATADHVTWLDRPRKVLGDAAMVTAASAARETYALAPAMASAVRAADARPRLVPLRNRLGLAA